MANKKLEVGTTVWLSFFNRQGCAGNIVKIGRGYFHVQRAPFGQHYKVDKKTNDIQGDPGDGAIGRVYESEQVYNELAAKEKMLTDLSKTINRTSWQCAVDMAGLRVADVQRLVDKIHKILGISA